MDEIIEKLQGKDNSKAYAFMKQIAAESASSDKYYTYFDGFLSLITAKNSYIRTRGFLLCCAQARWDTTEKLKNAMPTMLRLLHDPKPTVLRQCLSALHEVVLYRPELCHSISAEIDSIDLSLYKDSMSPLIKKDIDDLKSLMG